ncbi:MAG: carbohydrate kinase, partial [Dermacoccus nishinomiyaensis]
EARQRLAHAREDDVRPALARAIATSSTTVTRAGSNPPTREEIAGL